MALADRDRICTHGRDFVSCEECQAAHMRKRQQIEHQKSVARQRERLIIPRWKRQ